jgi:Rrf2 family protein
MKISQKGLHALQALMMLARHHNQGATKIRHIAYEELLPEKFLELILLEPKNVRVVDSVRGAKGGYRLRRDPSDIHLSEIIRLIDGPLAPDQLRELIDRDIAHRMLCQVFLDVRDAAARILDQATLVDLIADPNPRVGKGGKRTKNQKKTASVLPMVVGGAGD